jgi:fused signal recognition particle receptor
VELLYIAIAVLIAAAAVYFLFIRKPPELPAPPSDKQLPPKPKDKPVAAAPEKKQVAERAAPSAAKPSPADEAEPPEQKDEAAAAPVAEAPASPPAGVEKPGPAAAALPSVQRPPKEPSAAPPPHAARKRDVEGLRRGLTKVREQEGFFGRLKALFTGKKEIDPQIVEQIEEVLLTSDVGVKTTEALLSDIKEALQKNELSDDTRVWKALRERATRILDVKGGGGLKLAAEPTVVMVVGVNGVGKTTTIGKLATKLKAEGKTVVLAAGDTFRAAAVQQLNVWGKRVGCEVVRGKDGANPGAVIFDAIQKAKEIGADVVLADTAGRLHTKANLMDELTKVARTMTKALEGAPHETLLVLDATNGQNAMQQAAMFKESLPLTGIVLTKLDGTAKGGVILGIVAEHGLPVRYIGIGERAEDLRDFVAEEFVEAMLGQSDSADAAA